MRIAIIPARGGSRRIPQKNIRPFMGRPIIAYSIQAARECGLFDRIIVSSDDPKTRIIARQCGAEAIERDAALAMDEVGTQEVMADALRELLDIGAFLTRTPEYACCIYPCAPLLRPYHISATYDWLTVFDLTYAYIEGWLYWGKAKSFLDGVPIAENRGAWYPRNWIDINTPEDWVRAEEMYAKQGYKEAA